ncbi:MAG TPA: CocE/NonD family hydrolase C-terminal non-catalytic domain-containing protein [Acidimicrobiales bacterium]|nr:CocE/NonD family hydrolase C-terminal non-catalytic domain-containing protein [Acidimicrobiales bacterium]
MHLEADVAQRGLEHRAQVLLVVDEQQGLTGHRSRLSGIPVRFLRTGHDGGCVAVALLAARLSDVAQDGSATLVSFGVLNLTHRLSHEAAAPLELDEPMGNEGKTGSSARTGTSRSPAL